MVESDVYSADGLSAEAGISCWQLPRVATDVDGTDTSEAS